LQLSDASKVLSPGDPKYAQWMHFASSLEGAGHRFNSRECGPRETTNYLVRQYDYTGRMLVETVNDYPSARRCSKELDRLVPAFLTWLVSLGATLPKSRRVPARMLADAHKRLMRRAEHWKAKAYAMVLIEETPSERAARRQRALRPLWKRAGISSDEAWAERAGGNIDRNTPRDYRAGKTKKLRSANRKALAEALGVAETDLPE